jgi:hypothetical protein
VNNNIPNVSNPPHASNTPQASNNPISSVITTAKRLGKKNKRVFLKIFCFVIIFTLIVLCARWIYAKKKKSKVGYFYDENGNPEEKAKVVYIQ